MPKKLCIISLYMTPVLIWIIWYVPKFMLLKESNFMFYNFISWTFKWSVWWSINSVIWFWYGWRWLLNADWCWTFYLVKHLATYNPFVTDVPNGRTKCVWWTNMSVFWTLLRLTDKTSGLHSFWSEIFQP